MDNFIQLPNKPVTDKKSKKRLFFRSNENKNFLINTIKEEAGESVLNFISDHFGDGGYE